MPFQILRGSLPLCCCDAIVNPTDEIFSGSGGLDGFGCGCFCGSNPLLRRRFTGGIEWGGMDRVDK